MESDRDSRLGAAPSDAPVKRKEGVERPRLTPAYTIPQPLSADDIADIALDAYLYAFPLVLMEMSRRTMANVAEPDERGLAPMNRFGHKGSFPDATCTDVVRPNADTLYSTMFFDVSLEPLVVTVPDSGGRYYLLPMLDMWTNVFASPGKRTTGTGAQAFAIVGPTWAGSLPDGVREVRSPTCLGWVVGRTQTNGTGDYPRVRKFQAEFRTTPLSKWGTSYSWPKADVDPAWKSSTSAVEQVMALDTATFYALFMDLVKLNPPHADDYPLLDRLRRIGIVPGKPFDFTALSAAAQRAFREAVPLALTRTRQHFRHAGELTNGWRTHLAAIGSYGTNYLNRASVAFAGLGANTPEDTIYATAVVDADGNPFTSDARYVMHFEKMQIPPVRAFWSLTVYDERHLFAESPISRYAIGDRDTLSLNPDDSLDIHIQRGSPGREMESNWLPTPASGGFSMNLRLYWPKAEVLAGDWSPPTVKRV